MGPTRDDAFRKTTKSRCMKALGPLLLLAFLASDACAEWAVWTVADTRRVLREAPAGSGCNVRLAAARNERESFQVLMRSDSKVKGVRLVPGDLKGPDGAVLRADDARLFREHQLHLGAGSYRNDNFVPGWYPDPLIPHRNPQTLASLAPARFVAMPFDLPKNETHGFWVDIYVPLDVPSGDYHGTYRLTADGHPPVEIPVRVTVWDITLPFVPAMKTALGSPAQRMRAYYRDRAAAGKGFVPEDWAQIERQCAAMLSEHRINATPPPGTLVPIEQPDGSFEIPAEHIEALREFIDRYHVNACALPHPRRWVRDIDRDQPKLRALFAAFDRAIEALDRPGVTFFIYLRCEPDEPDSYNYVRFWGRAIRATLTRVKLLVIEQTWPEKERWGDLYGAVDIWCPLCSLFKPSHALTRQNLGEEIWTYTALCQRARTPWWHTDHPLLNYRVPCWITWRYDIRGLVYWGGMSYWQGVEDPWTEPATLDRHSGAGGASSALFNGEGVLVYPARAVGYDGIAPSMRLKALRDGLEDYDLLTLAAQHGKAAEARQLAAALAPSWFDWDPDPTAYDTAREKVAELILSAPNVKAQPEDRSRSLPLPNFIRRAPEAEDSP
jgi:hypothetical protein